MKRKKVAATAAFIFLGFSGISEAAIVDQINYSSTSFSDGINSNEIKQQEVKAGMSGQLTGFDFMFLRVTNYGINSPSFDFFVNIGNGWQTDQHDFVTTIDLTSYPRGEGDAWYHIDTTPGDINLSAGDMFIIGMKANTSGGGMWISGSYYNDQYSNGVYLSYDPAWDTTYGTYHDGEADLNFQTYIEPTPTPIPGAIWLFGSGIAGLAGTRIRRKNK